MRIQILKGGQITSTSPDGNKERRGIWQAGTVVEVQKIEPLEFDRGNSTITFPDGWSICLPNNVFLVEGREIKLPIYGITIKTGEFTPGLPYGFKGGTITSTGLHEEKESADAERYNAALDALESFILACAGNGIDVTTPQFIVSINTTIDAIGNNLM